MNAEQLAAIKARWAAATPGPWTHTSGATKEYVESEDGDLSFSLQHFHPSDGHEWPCADTASAIAHAPADIAALVTEVEQLQTAGVDALLDRLDAAAWPEVALVFTRRDSGHAVEIEVSGRSGGRAVSFIGTTRADALAAVMAALEKAGIFVEELR